MKLQIATHPFTSKPEKFGIVTSKNEAQQESSIKDVSPKELADYIARGYTISPGVLIGGRSAINWTEQTYFMVDIDNVNESAKTITPEEAIELSLSKGLKPSFYYHTFNSRESNLRFRLVYILDRTITSNEEREIIVSTLVKMFDQSDKACTNADRVFLGTNKGVEFIDEEATISLDQVVLVHEPVESIQKANKRFSRLDLELDDLKSNFDFLGYLKEQNGETTVSNSKYVMFKYCQLCGHHDNLVYYHATKTFMCFSSAVNRGGSIIDYLMIQQHLTLGRAIEYFKTEL